MKKILVILNGTLIAHHLVNAAIVFANATASYLHIILTDYSLDLAAYNYPFPNDLALTRNRLSGKTIAEEDAALLADNIRLLVDTCETAKIKFSIDPDKEIYLGKLLNYSAFSDFILADATENLQQGHIADLLLHAHCPVYLVSKKTTTAANIIFTYDGSASSMFAIKSFTCLFPEYKSQPAWFVHVAAANLNVLPHQEEINGWLKAHYNNVQVKIIHGNLRESLVDFTQTISNPLVIMGSFGRSAFSNFFHKSVAHAVIEEGNASLFIAHA